MSQKPCFYAQRGHFSHVISPKSSNPNNSGGELFLKEFKPPAAEKKGGHSPANTLPDYLVRFTARSL
jgi:hypothetical protein